MSAIRRTAGTSCRVKLRFHRDSLVAGGANVAIGDINEEATRETLDLVNRAGADCLFVRTNVSVEADVEKLVAATVERFGRLVPAQSIGNSSRPLTLGTILYLYFL
jgi:NAD(P)-dependent dehydrogenase (short-subunit alcohol dehydrogenase family)